MSNWWKQAEKIPFESSNFQKIIQFYLFECPVVHKKGKGEKQKLSKVSNRGKTLREYGWENNHLKTLIANMKKTSTGRLEYKVIKIKSEIINEYNNFEKGHGIKDKNCEILFMYERNDMSKTESFFYYIRNAFAHGSFSVKNNTYYLENLKDGEVTARIRLREKTLLNWIDMVKMKPDNIKKQNNREITSKKRKNKVA